MGYQKSATVILVPGAWADGSSWGTVINSIASAGLNVICAPIPLTTLGDDIATVERVVAKSEGPVLLVAHAYAGTVIASVDDEKVKGLVYITALAPDEGEATVEIFTREAAHPDAPKMAPDENGYVWMPHEAISKAFSPNSPADEQVRLEAIQRPLHVSCITEKVRKPAWKSKPAWFLIAKHDHMILEKTQRFMAERMKATIRTADSDHLPSLTLPKPVVEIILEAAKATLSA